MRIWIRIGLACVSLGLALGEAGAKNSSVVYQRRTILGLPVNVITVNLNDPEVKVTAAIARQGVGSSEAFQSLINRVHPAAAITGAFFDTRSLKPVGDIVINGEQLHQGVVGTGVAFTADNSVDFVPLRRGRRTDWTPYEAVVCAGPWLVKDGWRTVRPRAEGYRDRSLYALRPRAAIGFTGHRKMLLVTIPKPAYYTHVSKVMKALGAVNALGLDGGSSTALSIRGRIISKPSRRLTNVLLVYDKPHTYERAITHHRLFPRRPERRPPTPAPLESAPEAPLAPDGVLDLDPEGRTGGPASL
ncbi:MAG: phosphodiester glycosidase family protein [Armatimonadetes bacterium]|nr:phosphodiester glycosidase family protein [Armatimonadota bacterium]